MRALVLAVCTFGLFGVAPTLAQRGCEDGASATVRGTIHRATQQRLKDGDYQWIVVPRDAPIAQCGMMSSGATDDFPRGARKGEI